MKTVLTVIALVLALGAAGAAGYGFLERGRETENLNKTIGELESRLAAAEQKFADFQELQNKKSAQAGAVPKAVEKDLAYLREKYEGVNTRVEVLGTQVSALREADKKNKVQMAQIAKAAESSPSGTATGSMVRKEDIEDLIDEKMKGREHLGKEPPLAAVSARLGLEDFEKKALEDILRQKKSEMLNIMKKPRTDGGSMLDDFADDIIDAMVSGDEQEAKKVFVKLFQRLATDKVPGTDKTYFVEMIRLQGETKDAFKGSLSENQYNAFNALGIENAMDIKIENDPFGAYIQERMQARGVTPGQGQ